jgi:preprotein translocase subunit SecA
MSAQEVEDKLKTAAIEQIDKRDCAPLMKYLEPLFAENELVSWAAEKFGIKVDPKEMLADVERRIRKPADEIAALIEEKAHQAYAQREIEYPVDHVLISIFGNGETQNDNPYAADMIRNWSMAKFREEFSLDEIRSMPIRRLRDRLIGLQEQYLEDGKVETEVDRILAEGQDHAVIAKLMNERFMTQLHPDDLAENPPTPVSASNRKGIKPEAAAPPLKLRDRLIRAGREFFRKELTDLEQFVMIQIFDQSWKDHLYAMDMLRNGIGLQAFAEKDPRIQYKKEGYKYFAEMMEGIRDKVTDLIFRARIVGNAQARNAYQVTSATHEDTGGYGVGEHAAELGGTTAGGDGEGGGGEVGQKVVKPIIRETPKVGRNDPCPCGSGRKYKKCHGANAA